MGNLTRWVQATPDYRSCLISLANGPARLTQIVGRYTAI
jgi:hypothetical protein